MVGWKAHRKGKAAFCFLKQGHWSLGYLSKNRSHLWHSSLDGHKGTKLSQAEKPGGWHLWKLNLGWETFLGKDLSLRETSPLHFSGMSWLNRSLPWLGKRKLGERNCLEQSLYLARSSFRLLEKVKQNQTPVYLHSLRFNLLNPMDVLINWFYFTRKLS